MDEIKRSTPSANWKWRVHHGRETYAGQLERTAATAAAGDTYERRWHDSFVNGRRKYTTSEDARGRLFAGVTDTDMEFRPELPAPRTRPPRANPFYALSADEKHTARARDPTNPDYFSDAESERTASVAEEYKDAERADKAAAGVNADRDARELVARKEHLPPSKLKHGKSAQQAEQASTPPGEMAGRGRGKPGGLKGVTWEYDPSIKLESKPIELFPPHPNLKRPAPLTDKEKREIGHYKRLQRQVHRGPLYTQPTKRYATAPAKTFGEDQFNRQYSTNPKADFDPFTGVETYSQRLQPKVNEIPKFSGRSFNKELFPKELWPALEGEAGNEVRKHLDRANEKKAAMMAGVKDRKPDDKHARVLEKLFSVPADEEAEEVDEDQEQDAEVDSNFDDESMGGDYDAEQYFDNGEDNSEGEGGGGDDDY